VAIGCDHPALFPEQPKSAEDTIGMLSVPVSGRLEAITINRTDRVLRRN
jgi:hypothetical protein